MFYINAIPAIILFDFGATHSFMSARYANTNVLPLKIMKTPMIVITPKGPVEANHMTHKLTLTIMGRELGATALKEKYLTLKLQYQMCGILHRCGVCWKEHPCG
jgi:hypothetical protein